MPRMSSAWLAMLKQSFSMPRLGPSISNIEDVVVEEKFAGVAMEELTKSTTNETGKRLGR